MKRHPRGCFLLHTCLLYVLCLVSGYSATINLTTAAGLAEAGTTNGDIAIVAGYHTAGDGGGGTFTLDTTSSATADGGFVFTRTTGGRWLRQVPEGTLNVKMFGARSGQSVTTNEAIENTNRIQKAIDSAVDNGHETVRFLGGYYKLGRPVLANDDGQGHSGFGIAGTPIPIRYAQVDSETAEAYYFYLRIGAHQSATRPNLRLAGEGATLHGITEVDLGSTVLLIRTKFTSVEVDNFTILTTTKPASNFGGRYNGINIVPMQAPLTGYYAGAYSDTPPAGETQALRDAPTDLIAITNTRFVNCRSAIAALSMPRRDFLTHTGNLKKVSVQKCEFLYPNGSDTVATYANDGWPAAAMIFRSWLGELHVADCLFDGATIGDATPGAGGNNRGPVDNFIMSGGVKSVIERNVVKHAGVEGISHHRSDGFPALTRTINGSSTVTVAADKSLILEFILYNNVGTPLAYPHDLPPTLKSQLPGLRVRLAANFGDNSTSIHHGEYEIAEVLQDGSGNWNRVKLVSTGDPRNLAANSTLDLQDPAISGPGWGAWTLYLAPSELEQRDLVRTAVVTGNEFGGDPVANSSGSWWYAAPGLRIDDVRLTATDNVFDRCAGGIMIVGRDYASEISYGSLIDRNRFELPDYHNDTHAIGTEAFAAAIFAPGVSATNNAIHSKTNKKVIGFWCVFNCGDVSISGNSIVADRKLTVAENEKGHAINLNNLYGGAMNADHRGYVANNHIHNFDYDISTNGSPVYTAFGNSNGNGVPEFSIAGNYTSVHTSNLSLAGGNALDPSFNFGVNGDANTGIFQPNVDSVGISLDGTLVAKFTQGTYTPSGGSPTEFNALQMTAGTDDRPGYGFLGDDDTGMFHKDEDSIGFATGGEERVGIQNAGLLIGAGTPLKMVKALSTNAQWTSAIAASTEGTTSNIAFAGAALGDVVLIQWDPSNLPPSKLIMSAYVSSAGNVKIRAYNAGGTSVAAATYPVKIVVLQFAASNP